MDLPPDNLKEELYAILKDLSDRGKSNWLLYLDDNAQEL